MQRKLLSKCKKNYFCVIVAFISWARFYASYPKELRYIFNFKELHLGHYAKSFALQEAPKTISGIGKPKNLR